MMMAPSSADMTETMINVKAHPSSPAASERKECTLFYLLLYFWGEFFFVCDVDV